MPAVSGTKLTGRDSGELARELALALGVEQRLVSRGSRHELMFLADVYEALAGTRPDSSDPYELVASAMEAAGITYDALHDTDEATDKARKQVHARAYSRLLAAISGIPRCFILNVTDSERGAAWETDSETTYRFDDRVSGRKPLLVAGQGSRVVYYSTSRSTEHQMQFIAAARVEYIAGGALGPWEASLSDYVRFPHPVPRRDVDLPGWNHQHAITEISHETYAALLQAGGLDTGDVEVVTSDPMSPVEGGAGESALGISARCFLRRRLHHGSTFPTPFRKGR